VRGVAVFGRFCLVFLTGAVVLLLASGARAEASEQLRMHIVGGTPVDPASQIDAWEAMIVIEETDGSSFLCGGSVLGSRWVLTAAHCVTPSPGAQLAALTIHVTARAQYQFRGPELAAAVHGSPRYDPQTNASDWALIRLPADCRCLAIRLDSRPQPPRAVAMVVGHGATSPEAAPSVDLLAAYMAVAADADCLSVWGSEFEPTSMLCAIGDGRSATCVGDSGGPLSVVGEWGMRSQIGIVSWGDDFCSTNVPEVYTRISSALPDILATMRADSAAPVFAPTVVLGKPRLTKAFRNAITVPYQVNAGGLATYILLEWGTTRKVGSRRSTPTIFTRSTPEGAVSYICNPKPGRTYWIRATAMNSIGITQSDPIRLRIPKKSQAPTGFFADPCSHPAPTYF
jgi:chymotrypsin